MDDDERDDNSLPLFSPFFKSRFFARGLERVSDSETNQTLLTFRLAIKPDRKIKDDFINLQVSSGQVTKFDSLKSNIRALASVRSHFHSVIRHLASRLTLRGIPLATHSSGPAFVPRGSGYCGTSFPGPVVTRKSNLTVHVYRGNRFPPRCQDDVLPNYHEGMIN